MGVLAPTPTPFPPLEWEKKPFPERAREACVAWAMTGYGTPLSAYLFYAAKIALYVAGWIAFTGPFSTVARWWLTPVAFEKAIVWSMLFEALGLGCGSGPLTGRYVPPFGGVLHFARPGTTKLPLVAALGVRRNPLDVILYMGFVALCLRALVAPAPGFAHFWPLAAIVPAMGVADRTLFLAARAEHFWTTIVCFAFARDWVPAAMAVQLALWFWAGVSKLNHHFPTVACVMTSNSPLLRFRRLRRALYADYPRDLRPSRLAAWMAHGGTLLEFAVPIAFLATPRGTPPVVAIALMLALHAYITSNVPMGVPLEWNVVVVYGGFALFWAHPDASLAAIAPWPVAAFLAVMLIALPTVGNFFPRWVSFLVAMRYYAGNWAWSVWLFRGDASRKLDRLTRSSARPDEQLGRLLDRATIVGVQSRVMAFRLMHLHGRALGSLVPKAVGALDGHEWMEGEVVAGLALGWNFGEGHLHQERLLDAIQAQCGFEEGECVCVFGEAQPLFGRAIGWRIVDAKRGLVEAGEVAVEELRARQPWPT